MKEYELYEGALQKFEERGWCAGDFEDTNGKVCAIGALALTEYGAADITDLASVTEDAFLWTDEKAPTLTRLARRHLRANGFDLNRKMVRLLGAIPFVNDEFGRETMEDLLRKATRDAKANEAIPLPDPHAEVSA